MSERDRNRRLHPPWNVGAAPASGRPTPHALHRRGCSSPLRISGGIHGIGSTRRSACGRSRAVRHPCGQRTGPSRSASISSVGPVKRNLWSTLSPAHVFSEAETTFEADQSAPR